VISARHCPEEVFWDYTFSAVALGLGVARLGDFAFHYPTSSTLFLPSLLSYNFFSKVQHILSGPGSFLSSPLPAPQLPEASVFRETIDILLKPP